MNPLQMFILFLKMTPLDEFATKLEADLADGTITVAEGFDLVATVTMEAQGFLPGAAAELELANDVAEAVVKYMAASAPQSPPVV